MKTSSKMIDHMVPTCLQFLDLMQMLEWALEVILACHSVAKNSASPKIMCKTSPFVDNVVKVIIAQTTGWVLHWQLKINGMTKPIMILPIYIARAKNDHFEILTMCIFNSSLILGPIMANKVALCFENHYLLRIKPNNLTFSTDHVILGPYHITHTIWAIWFGSWKPIFISFTDPFRFQIPF